MPFLLFLTIHTYDRRSYADAHGKDWVANPILSSVSINSQVLQKSRTYFEIKYGADMVTNYSSDLSVAPTAEQMIFEWAL